MLRSSVFCVLSSGMAGAVEAQSWRDVTHSRYESAAAYDLARGRIVLFGGDSVVGPTSNTWEYDGNKVTRATTANSPTLRFGHALAADWTRNRIVLFGGLVTYGVSLSDTWEYNGTNWSQVATAVAPPQRAYHALAYDLLRARTVLFGGSVSGASNSSVLGDTWEYDGTNWFQTTTATTPPPRCRHALAYDAVRARTVLFGGSDNSSLLHGTWEYDGTDWSLVATAATPNPRIHHALAYDLQRGRTVLFGGSDGTSAVPQLDDTWEYDGRSWTFVCTGPVRRQHALAYDVQRSRTVLFGGADRQGARSDLWVYDGTAWSKVLTSAPSPRTQSALAHDNLRGRSVLFGGCDRISVLGDTWECDGTQWSRITTPVAPSARCQHALAFDSGHGCVVLFGGLASLSVPPFNDTWHYDGTHWSLVSTAVAPSGRWGHALAYDLGRNRSVLFGGMRDTFAVLTDTWEYDGTNWSRVATAVAPPPLSRQALAYDCARSRTVLYISNSAATWEYDGSNWSRVMVGNAPPSLGFAFGFAYDHVRGRSVVVGTDLWQYDGTTWTATPAHGVGGGDTVLAYDSVRGHLILCNDGGATWELPPPTTLTWTRFGLGCPGSGGTPVLDRVAGSLPALGMSFQLRLSSLPASPGALVLAFGSGITRWNGAALPVDLDTLGLPSCKLWIEPRPGAVLLLAHAGASATLNLPIPWQTALRGMRVPMQAFVFDAAAPNGIGAVTNAGIATLH